MAEEKKSIVVYADWIKKFEILTDEEAGRLIKHFFRYVNDLRPIAPDRITQLSFIDIEQCLKRDLVKWEQRAERSRSNGSKGGRPAKHQKPEKPTETQQVILEPEKPDNVNVSVNVNGINNNCASDFIFEDFWKLYPIKKDKKKAESKWEKIKEADKIKIKNTIQLFVDDIPFKTYVHPYATTYLNSQRWNDYEGQQKEIEDNSISGNSLKDQMNAVRTY